MDEMKDLKRTYFRKLKEGNIDVVDTDKVDDDSRFLSAIV